MALSVVLEQTFAQLGFTASDDLLQMASNKISQGYSIHASVELAMQEWDEMWEAFEVDYQQQSDYYAQFDY